MGISLSAKASSLRWLEEVWMVGDNPIADVVGAEALGIQEILVRSNHPGVKRYSKSLKQAPRILGNPR